MAMYWSGLNGTRVAHVAFVGCLLLAVAAAFPVFGGHGILALELAADSAEGWERESYPVGCGFFGANVFGLVGDERVQVTHNIRVISRRM